MVTRMNEPTIEMLERLLDAFNAHDLDAVMSFFVDDCVLEMPRGPDPWGRRFEGRDRVREGLADRFAGIPDVHYGEHRHWVSGSRGCSEWLLTGTTTEGRKIGRNAPYRGRGQFQPRQASWTMLTSPAGLA